MRFIREFKPLTPSLRFLQLSIFFFKVKKNILKILNKYNKRKLLTYLFIKKNNSGINCTGKKVFKVRSKSLINKIYIDVYKDNFKIIKNSYVMLDIIKLNKKLLKYYIIIKDTRGFFFLKPFILGYKPGYIILNLFYKFKLTRYFNIFGYFLLFKYLYNYNSIIISNISLTKNNKITYIKSNGTFTKFILSSKFKNFFIIKLPSGKKKYFSEITCCLLGKNYDMKKKFITIGKAGINRNLGKKQKVRGVAMNPVDHPHGGRTKTNKPEVSPWGWVTKKSK